MGHPTQGGVPPNVNSGYVNPADIDYDYGACDTDRRHLFNLTAGVQSPEFHNAAVKAIASNWRLSGILRLFSGRPLNVTVASDPARSGIGSQRANISGDGYGGDLYNRYLDPTAFTTPTVGTLGNLPRNALVGPKEQRVDLALVRAFRFANTHRIEARVEAFNAFNWFNPGLINAPVTNRDNIQFGRMTSADDPRIMQFAVKYSF